MQYMRQMQWFSNNLPDVINTGAQNRFFPMPMMTYMYRNSYLPPMRPSNPAMFQRSWQQYFQQMGMMGGNQFNFGPQGGFPQPNRPFGQGSGPSFGGNPGGPFGANSGSSFGSNSGSDSFGSDSFGSSGSGGSFGSDSFGSSGSGGSFGSSVSGGSFGSSGTGGSFGSDSFGS